MSVRRTTAGIVLFGLLVAVVGCAGRKEAAAPTGGKGSPELKSTAFEHGQAIPAKYTGDGEDVSPPLAWTNLPAGTTSIVIICDDPDAPMGTFVHWLIYDVPAKENGLAEGVPRDEQLRNGACQGTNDFGRYGYIGPSPPPGGVHHYHFRLYALSKPTGLKPGASRADIEAAMKGKILGTTELVGTYQR